MNCRVCDSPNTIPLPEKYPLGWHRCPTCGSDSAAHGVAKYDAPYIDRYEAHIDFEDNIISHRSNLDWLCDHAKPGSFLDVGCADGASLAGMALRGWMPCIGFDINPATAGRTHFPVIVAPRFNASYVPRMDAVLSREVIEHIEDWREHLQELANATKPGGLLQIQTPIPDEISHSHIYQSDHLQIFRDGILQNHVSKLGFDILDSRTWNKDQSGQAFLARKKK